MVDGRVAAIGSQTQHFGLVDGTWLNWRPSRALRRKQRQLVGKVGEWYVASLHLQGCISHLCRLRTDGLTLTSKYWTYRSHAGDMGPVGLVVRCQQKLNFFSLLHCLLWERGWVWTRVSVSRRAVDCVRSPSSQGQWARSNLLMTVRKVVICGPREICMILDHMWTKHGKRVACWSGFFLQGVHQFESP
jgi:hypothetical protein